MRTLLVGHAGIRWREWLRSNLRDADLVLLDPADAGFGAPGRLRLIRDERPLVEVFYGSLDPLRAPHLMIAGLVAILESARDTVIVQLAAYAPSPLMRQSTLRIAQLLRPDAIFVAEGTQIELNGFPIGPTKIELEEAFPKIVEHARRKAQWIKFIESCTEQEIDLDRAPTEGSRLGSGAKLKMTELKELPFDGILHAETSGGKLFVVAEGRIEDDAAARIMDATGCSQISVAHPDDYKNVYCSFARENGTDFGYGLIQFIDFERRIASVLSDAVAPAPVKLLRFGSLRVDPNGNELAELKPWSV